jgi:hypothetical protein
MRLSSLVPRLWLLALVTAMLGCARAGRLSSDADANGPIDAKVPSGDADASTSQVADAEGGSDGSIAAETGDAAAETGDAAAETGDAAAETGDAAAEEAERAPECAGLFCEDFESGQIDPDKWDLRTGVGGTLVVQEQRVAHGKFALQVHGVAGPADYALIVTKAAPAALRGAHFGRVTFFITPKPLTSGHTQMFFAGTNGPGVANGPGPFPKLRYLEVANINGGWQIGFDLLDVAPLVEEVAYPAGAPRLPTEAWTCLEWQFTDEPDVVNLWVDGQATGTFDDRHVSYPSGHTPGTPLSNGTSSGLIGGFTMFGLGFHDWHPNKAFDLFYDDLVLDTKRVGCPSP